MTTFTCPKGHPSTTGDFCDTCGAKIGGTAAFSPATAAPAASSPVSSPGGDPCPNCGTPRSGAGRFCEDCGFDHSTGRVPTLAQPPAAPTAAGRWTATVYADREYFEANAIEGVDFPEQTDQRTVTLPPPQVRIGRRSASKGTDPEIDLADADPGVSHSHALLTLSVDGVWLVSDLGSTNGTWLNDEQKPLTAGQTRGVGDGDRVHVGAWTTITLHAPAG
ncbi:FHA domain-containing protein [Actinoplanes sp. NPDC049668]|uniref:FHA domain-containing protein n=1 Tax=unclassified Actinoplanes TaxID=2626549 RepID=UPI0033AE08DF